MLIFYVDSAQFCNIYICIDLLMKVSKNYKIRCTNNCILTVATGTKILNKINNSMWFENVCALLYFFLF